MKKFFRNLGLAAVSIAVTGCATIDPELVTDNHKQRKGIRYYETRPFVVVHKPFPLESESVLVDGMVSPDGMTFLVTGRLQEPFTHFKGAFSAVNGRMIILDPDAGLRIKGQGGESKDGDEGQVAPELPSGSDKSTAGEKAGTSSLTLTTDNTGVPVISLNEYVSLTYLPDYDREFVMRAEGRFGIKNVTLVRGPGGTLLGLNATVDNGAIVDPMMKAYGSIVTAGSDALIASLSPGGAVAAVAQGASRPDRFPEELRGKPFTFRLHLFKFAAVGIYPFVKPSEVDSYRAVAATKVVQPTVGYQVPYRYFELLVAEPLFVDDVLAFTASKGEAGKPTGSCNAQLQTSAASKENLLSLLESAIEEELTISEVTIDKEGPKGCVRRLIVKAGKKSGENTVALSNQEKADLQAPFSAGLGLENTDLTIRDPD